MLVPESARYGFEPPRPLRPLSRFCTFWIYRKLPGADSDTVPTPGATRSGFAAKSIAVGPFELKSAIVSSPRVSVPLVLDAPTVRTHGALPGAVIAPYCSWSFWFFPRLPAAVTTVMPLSVTALAASVSGSVQYDSDTPAPTDMLTTLML